MGTKLSRRDFLKLIGLGTTGLAFQSQWGNPESLDYGEYIRITTNKSVSVHHLPWDESRILYQRFRDELIPVYYDVDSTYGPGYNSKWYRIWRGYIHSAHTQKVKTSLNPVLDKVPEDGLLTEITVPYSRSMVYSRMNGWEPLYRLYYQSNHWIIGIDEGPDGEPWYIVEDELDSHIKYFVTASHLRHIPPEEYSPISPEIPPEKKRIEISITMQTLTAYEGDEEVKKVRVSTGLNFHPPDGGISWNTPHGDFNVYSKMPSKHMGDGILTADMDAYELPGVPWVCFFAEHGVATHGTYWHTNYGTVMSHGCVNLTPEDAKWVFRWATPVSKPEGWEARGLGTRVIVQG